MLIAFMAVAVCFRSKFRNRFTWLGSMGVFLVCLFLTHSWTGFLAAALIFAGAVLDQIDWKKFHFRKIYWAGIAGLAVLAAVAGKLLMGERDLTSLGGRRDIWSGALRAIAETPTGWGYRFGEELFPVAANWSANNAHNVFLNAMLRFSVPVGICFILLIALIAVYSLVKSRSWLAVGMWLAFLMLLNMDYSLLNYEMGMFLFTIYLVCIYQPKEKENSHELVKEAGG
jgi:hypothetical protein